MPLHIREDVLGRSLQHIQHFDFIKTAAGDLLFLSNMGRQLI
jgi:hypothetical protein